MCTDKHDRISRRLYTKSTKFTIHDFELITVILMNLRNSNTAISLMGFLPALVVKYLMHNKKYILDNINRTVRQLPDKQSFRSVVMFADISGFTNLTETLSKIGHEGAEVTAFAINRYMELLVSAISRSGGDIFKFAGDAIIVVWPPSLKEKPEEQEEELKMTCRQALQSALDIQAKLDNTNILENLKLSVKIGFGIGDISIIYVGGVFGRSEYLATGDPLTQAFQSEHLATAGGQTIVSQEFYEMVEEFFIFQHMEDEHTHKPFHKVIKLDNKYKVKMKADALLIKNQVSLFQFNEIKTQVLRYIPAALVPYIEIDCEKWSSELRRITVLFINLGIDLRDANTSEGLAHIQKVIETVQKCVYMHEGSLNKLLMDDKGSTLIVCFGLPPLMHQDDATRAVLAGFLLVEQLAAIKCKCKIGIATGTVFTGVVGTSGSRREYSVIGDSVNLAARLMQAAIGNKLDILCCEQTAKDSQQKIICKHWKDIQLKGKSGLVPVYYPMDLKEKRKRLTVDQLQEDFGILFNLRTHFYSIPPKVKRQLEAEKDVKKSARKTLSQDGSRMIGRNEQLQQIKEVVSEFIEELSKDPTEPKSIGSQHSIQSQSDESSQRTFILVKGTFGIGKSFLVKSALTSIYNESEHVYLYSEKVKIMVSSLNPITKTEKLNGLRQILKEAFLVIAFRQRRQPDRQLMEELIKFDEENEAQWQFMEEVLGLREINPLDRFPPKPEVIDETQAVYERKIIGKMALKIFKHLLQEVPLKEKLKGKKYNLTSNPQEEEEEVEERKSETGNAPIQQEQAAPVIMCLDDMQYYDMLSFSIIKMLMKNFTRIMFIGIMRDQCWDVPFMASQKLVKKKVEPTEKQLDQYEIIDQCLDEIFKIENVNTKEIRLKGLCLKKDINEVAQLLQHHFGIQAFLDNEYEMRRKSSLVYTRKQGSAHLKQGALVTNDHFMFWESKELFHIADFTQFVIQYIYLRTVGHPLVIINLINNLINQEMIQVDQVSSMATVSWKFMEILSHGEWLSVDAPLSTIKMNSNIDRLSCLELLLCKFASVIGDIFDIQTLMKIIPFKDQINAEKLIRVMKELEKKDFIEYMDGSSENQFYRFVTPFIREVIYQRMIYSQRRQIHRNVAIAIQIIPQPFEYDEKKEQKKLEYHWLVAEQKAQIVGGNTIETHKQVRFSNKAKRSIIVKQIQQILAKNNYDLKAPLKTGILNRQSDKGVYWMKRICVIDSRDFKMYELENPDHPVSVLPLKQISHIYPVQFNQGQKEVFWLEITVTNWIKRATEQAFRTFKFNCESEDELEEWTIFLEFAKAKAIYNDFVENFGKISFPINLRVDAYDNQLTMELTQHLRKIRIGNGSKSMELQVQRQFKSIRQSKMKGLRQHSLGGITSPVITHKNSLAKRQVNSVVSEEKQELIREGVKEFFYKSLLVLWVHLITFQNQIQVTPDFQLGQPGQFMRDNIRFFQVKTRHPSKTSIVIDFQLEK